MAQLKIEQRSSSLWVIIPDPTIDGDFIAEIRSVCRSAANDPEVRSLVVTGGTAVFCEGWDEALLCDATALDEAGPLNDPFGRLADCPKPIICALNGNAFGGGLALALAADIRIAAETAHFALPEAKSGRLPIAGGTQRLLRLVGRAKALELILTGEAIDAKEALRIGLISEVVPGEALAKRAQEVADRLAERGPLALQYAKEAVSRGIDMTLEQALRFETDLTVILQTTEDRAEGVQAFREKRKPEFKGK